MNQGHKKLIAYIFIGGLLVSTGLTMGSIFGFSNPLGDYIAEGLGFDITPSQPTLEDGSARINSVIYQLGAEATYPSATVLIWHDWDADGNVDIGNVHTGDGEIETLSASSSSGFTSGSYYPVGATVKIQLQASAYEVVTYTRTVQGTPDSNGIVYLDNMPMMALDSSITVTVDAVGTAGTVAMVTDTGDYNYTLNGVNPTLTIRVACGTADSGIGMDGYNDWITGKAYHGTFVALKILLTEKSSVIFGSYDYLINDGTNQWIIWDLANPIFNDASLDDDGSTSISFPITITGEFDIDEVNIYDTVLETNFGQGTFGTADGQETNLDFIA